MYALGCFVAVPMFLRDRDDIEGSAFVEYKAKKSGRKFPIDGRMHHEFFGGVVRFIFYTGEMPDEVLDIWNDLKKKYDQGEAELRQRDGESILSKLNLSEEMDDDSHE